MSNSTLSYPVRSQVLFNNNSIHDITIDANRSEGIFNYKILYNYLDSNPITDLSNIIESLKNILSNTRIILTEQINIQNNIKSSENTSISKVRKNIDNDNEDDIVDEDDENGMILYYVDFNS